MISQTYIVKKQKGPLVSQANDGSHYWEITLKGCTDKRNYTTYVDTEMKNFDHWTTILEHPHTEYELGNLRVKDPNKRIINADSRPSILGGRGSTFSDLFTFDGE